MSAQRQVGYPRGVAREIDADACTSVDTLPKSNVGNILRRELRDQALSEKA